VKPDQAAGPLQAAVAAGLTDGPTRAALADSLWRLGRRREALIAFRDALFADPSSLVETQNPSLLALLDEIEELDLPGEPRAWIPALADLRGLVSLPESVLDPDLSSPPAARFTALVARYRRRRREGAAIAELLEVKRGLPFKTEVLGAEVTVERLDLTDDDRIVVVCTRGKSCQRIPIADLPLPDPPPMGSEWIDAYRRWARGR
jgi:hypothetical protein